MRQDSRVTILRPLPPSAKTDTLAADVEAGLTAPRKELPPKHFYDARGSALFEEITRLPEYYLTRAEREILESSAPRMIEELLPRALIEFGSGSSAKTRILLDAMRDAGALLGYGPVDVSASVLEAAGAALCADYPGLTVIGVVGDFEHELALPFGELPRLIAFLGSTIGNLDESAAVLFLQRVAAQLRPGEGFLVGFDLVKEVGRLEAAYDDAAGVTALFNLNLLSVINRKLDADFDPAAFEHRALYNEPESLIEMHLVSRRPQAVRIGALDIEVSFQAGESILTERSRKYTRVAAEKLLSRAGLELRQWETGEAGDFALGLARLAAGRRESRPGVEG
jgi:L-histidine N-alpha-methyltransferase